MDNHYHLVIETPDGSLAKGMRQLNGVYTQSYNRRHRRVGHLLQGRYKAIVVDKDEYLLEVCRYVVLNPVRAKVVEKPEGWKWSSYRATAGLEPAPDCLTIEWLLSQLSRRGQEAIRRYREFVRDGLGGERIYEKVKGQVLLGRDEFVGKLIGSVNGREEIKEIPVGRGMRADRNSKSFSARMEWGKKERLAREAVERYGYRQKEVADFLGSHYSTISRWINRDDSKSRIKT